MCDSTADAEAMEKTMVGRTLTLERVKELNAKDYFYHLLKDNPDFTKISPGIEDELLEGAIDSHIHAYPDFVHRAQDMIEVSKDAAKAGMRAVAFKDHWNVSANAAYVVQQHIDHLVETGELERGAGRARGDDARTGWGRAPGRGDSVVGCSPNRRRRPDPLAALLQAPFGAEAESARAGER